MKESSFWAYLRKVLPKEGHYTRIESECSPGFPDVHYTLDGASGTIELKSSKHPKATYPFRQKGDCLLRSQRLWIADECKVGGYVLLALQAAQTVWVLLGTSCAEDLHIMTTVDLSRAAIAAWRKEADNEYITTTLRKALTGH